MGAFNFVNTISTVSGVNGGIAKAFAACVAQEAYEYGHGGYTGTIAEKSDFRIIAVPENPQPTMAQAQDWVESLAGDYWSLHVDDKWGPAGAIECLDGYVFFGWASS